MNVWVQQFCVICRVWFTSTVLYECLVSPVLFWMNVWIHQFCCEWMFRFTSLVLFAGFGSPVWFYKIIWVQCCFGFGQPLLTDVAGRKEQSRSKKIWMFGFTSLIYMKVWVHLFCFIWMLVFISFVFYEHLGSPFLFNGTFGFASLVL